MSAVVDLPSGTLTFLFTDLEGSTANWERDADRMRSAVARHDELLTVAVEEHGGRLVKTTGDGVVAVFADPVAGVAGALECQRALRDATLEMPLRSRMGLYTGVAEAVDGDYHAPVLNRAARVMSAGHGGQVLLSASTAGLVRGRLPEGASLVDLGEHRLRDLGGPEVLFQLDHPDLSGSFPPLRTLDVLPGNLPLQVSSFVGRARELERVRDALSDHRVVTLTGVGGVGKTRLALQIAAELLPKYADGAWLVDLAPVRDPAGVAKAVATVFGVEGGTADEDPGSALVRAFGSKRFLLVLDNCEHLVGEVAELVTRLVGSATGLDVLATSREGLAIDGEQLVPVPPLRVDGDGGEAVELFVERARQVQPDFSHSGDNALPVTEICRRLDGVPLAIELAAARVIAFGPVELARRLDRRFEMLAGGRRGAVERHATLRAAIDWSFELLDEPQRVLLARLSVFAGSFDLDAVEAVCAGAPVDRAEVFELLLGLVAQSLVVVEQGDLGSRYRLLETIRQYGEERLEANELEVLRADHARHFAGYLRATIDEVARSGPEGIALAVRIDADKPNIVAAHAHALDTGDVGTAIGTMLGGALLLVPGEGIVMTPEPVLAMPGVAEHQDYPILLGQAGFWYVNQGKLDRAQHFLALMGKAIADHSDVPGDPYTEFTHSQLLAAAALAAGDFARSAELFRATADRARLRRLPNLEVSALGSAVSAGIQLAASSIDLREIAERALRTADRMKNPLTMAEAAVAQASVLARTDPDEARRHLLVALDLLGRPGHGTFSMMAKSLVPLLELGEWELTRAVARQGAFLMRWWATELFTSVSAAACARAVAASDPETAGVLCGAAYTLFRGASQVGVGGVEKAETARPSGGGPAVYLGALRDAHGIVSAQLGEDEARAHRARGLDMTPEETTAFILQRVEARPIQEVLAERS